MNFPERIATADPMVSLERVRPGRFAAYTRLLVREAEHVGRFRVLNNGSSHGRKFTTRQALQLIWEHLADPAEAHMGIYERSEFAGAVDLRPTADRSGHEIGIWVAEAHTRRGLARAALQAFLAPALRIAPDVIVRIHQDNLASIRLFEGVGFTHAENDGVIRHYSYPAADLQG